MAVTASTESASASRGSSLRTPARDRGLAAPGSPADGPSTQAMGPTSRAYVEALADLTERWERGETPGAERYLNGPVEWSDSQAVELIYREYRLTQFAGRRPSTDVFLARFPEHREALQTLFRLDGACSDSLLQRLFRPKVDREALLPRVGDEIGPYILKRELGRGGFARVFLAEQADLEYRLIVVKISTRLSREPWLLARARHPNIVEILTHAEVDDGALQMICMPFRGGATLSTILARRRERRAPRPSDRRLIDDLDAVAAPEYPETRSPGSPRDALRGASDPRAFAWIAARLADALDHAYSRGVAHGDVKPSNILLTADGNPMLLDFNLARDGAFHGPGEIAEDQGGTLAYMAPERLRRISETSSRARRDDASRTTADPHRADVYSLGIVLLEAVTGWSPASEVRDPGGAGPRAFGAATSHEAETRRSAAEIVGRAEAAGGGALPATLRSILLHSLEPDPSARYARGLELATDLDRWLADRPLAFAPEPSRRRAVGRWARRNRRGVAIVAFALALSTLTAGVFAALGSRSLTIAAQEHALERLARIWDDVASLAFRGQRPGFPASPGRTAAEEGGTALRALKEYKVLESDDWRECDDYRNLPAGDREELELWLIEQAYRAGRALADRPDSPDDWRRARTILDRASGPGAPSVVAALRDRLDGQLATAEGAGITRPTRRRAAPASPRVEEYLQGVAAELDEDEEAERARASRALFDPDADLRAAARRPEEHGPGLNEALKRYRRLLDLSPESFWGHYRCATIAFRLGRWGEAAVEIEACLHSRPRNPILHGFLATCLFNMERSDAALAASNRALDAAPDHAEFVQTRAFIRSGLPTTTALKADIHRYEVLKSLIPESFLRNPTLKDLMNPVAASVPASGRGMPLARPRKSMPINGERLVDLAEADPGELTSRLVFAARLMKTGKTELAAVEVEKILALDPDCLVARVDRMCLAIDARRFLDAGEDLDAILDHPMLAEYLVAEAHRVDALLSASRKFARNGETTSALALAEKTLQIVNATDIRPGRAYYTLAQVESIAARTEARWLELAALHIRLAIDAHPDFERWFVQDPTFTPVRVQIREKLDAARGL